MASLPEYGRSAEQLILGYGLPRPVSALWREINWQERGFQPAALDAEALDSDRPTIVVYPSLKALPDGERQRAFLRAFGQLLYRRFDAAALRRWKHKWTLPEPGHIQAFQSALRKRPARYRDIVESSQDPVQRLVSIHLANALIVNNVDLGDAAMNLEVRTWPSTEEFANCKRYYSLLPLLGAYCPPPMIDVFGEAFCELIVNRLENVYHTSVRGAFVALLLELIG